MNENKPQVATWALCVDIDPDNQESGPALICKLDMPLDPFKGGLIGVSLPGNMVSFVNCSLESLVSKFPSPAFLVFDAL